MYCLRMLVCLVLGFATAVPAHDFADSLADQKAISHGDQSFHVSNFDTTEAHYDANLAYDPRYMKQPLNKSAHCDASRALIQSYLITCHQLHVQTWLMNGSLLGWWWGKKTLPWDYSSNVQITESDLYFLAAYHNGTIHFHKRKAMLKGKNFLFEISPHFTSREPTDAGGAVDARWIDMDNGLYLNITAVRYSVDHPGGEGILYTKNGQQFHDTSLYPLRDTTFEGVPAKIPYRYREMLADRYGEAALKETRYKGHKFHKSKMQWVAQGESTRKRPQSQVA